MKARNHSAARKGAKSRFFKKRAGLQGASLYAVVAVTIIALLAVPSFVIYQSFGSGGGGSTQTSTSSSTGPSPAEQAVQARIHEYAVDMSNLDPNKMGALYTSSGVLIWRGSGINASAPFNKAGSYSSASSVTSFYAALFPNLIPAGGLQHPIGYSLVLTEALPSDVSTQVISSGTINATFRMYLNYSSGLFGDVGARINVHQQWTSQSSGGTTNWYVSRDDWDFTYSYIQYPVNTAAAK